MREPQPTNHSSHVAIPKSVIVDPKIFDNQQEINASRSEIEIDELDIQIYKPSSQEGQGNSSNLEQLPEDLHGYTFICAPLSPGDGTQVYNGDGMIYRLGFEAGKAKIKTRIAKTPCYYADQATKNGSLLYKFHNGGVARTSIILGSRNQLNTAFAQTRERLVVTFDAGRPYEIDPDTMELLEPVGTTKEWLPIFPIIPRIFQAYSNPAHPATDVSNVNDSEDLFTVNYSTGYNGKYQQIVNRSLNIICWINSLRQIWKKLKKSELTYEEFIGSFTDLVRYNFTTKKMERWRLTLNGQPLYISQAVHQIAITKDYIIIPDVPFMVEFSQIFSPFLFDWIRKNELIGNLGKWFSSVFLQLIKQKSFTSFYIVHREQLKKSGNQCNEPIKYLPVTKFSVPYEVSHFTADYQNEDGKITLHVGHRNGWDVTEWISRFDQQVQDKDKNQLRQDLEGMLVGPMDLGFLGRYVINGKSGALLDAKLVSDPESTWSLSVYTHRELCRDRENETETKIKNIYWVSWGFSWELIPQRIYDAYKESNYRTISYEKLPGQNKPSTLLRLNTESMEIVESFQFPAGYLACSPQFIPSSQSLPEGKDKSTHGYIVCVVLSDDEPKGEFWIFHADDFNGKPIYRLSHPELHLRFTIHSTWLPDIKKCNYSEAAYREKRRKESVELDCDHLIRNGSAKLQKIFDDVVYPHFVHQTPEDKLLKSLKEVDKR
ncbi:MAG: carotenoid oxygenase family protein [Scytonema hyalinum WJT4-NPBG1]|jgi:carotenoid cleavage dioxygenase-like enzyme|nr:carotenoid oxygenase family protein [Scytonema hyalinum WJT4-NPBG1]